MSKLKSVTQDDREPFDPLEKNTKTFDDMVKDYAKEIEKDTKYKGYDLSPTATRVDKIPINKEIFIHSPIVFELMNKKGQKIYIITTIDFENKCLKSIGIIEQDGKLLLETDYIDKINQEIEEKIGEKKAIDPEQETYLKNGEKDELELDEEKMKRAKAKTEIEQAINTKEGTTEQADFEVMAVYTLSRGASQSISNMCGVSLDKYENPKMIKGKDGTCRLVGTKDGKVIEVQGKECTQIVLAVEKALKLNNTSPEIKDTEIETGKTGERGSKTDLATFRPDGKDKEYQNMIEIGEGKVRKSTISVKTGAEKADVYGRQDYPIEDATIVMDMGGTKKVIKIRELQNPEQAKKADELEEKVDPETAQQIEQAQREEDLPKEEKTLWNSY